MSRDCSPAAEAVWTSECGTCRTHPTAVSHGCCTVPRGDCKVLSTSQSSRCTGHCLQCIDSGLRCTKGLSLNGSSATNRLFQIHDRDMLTKFTFGVSHERAKIMDRPGHRLMSIHVQGLDTSWMACSEQLTHVFVSTVLNKQTMRTEGQSATSSIGVYRVLNRGLFVTDVV